MVETVRSLGVDSKEATLVGLVDLGLLAGLVVIGQLSHNIDPLADPVGALETMAPFVIGWLVLAPIAGVYARRVLSSPVETARVTAIGWIAAANVGLILRSSPAFDGGAGWAFNAVMTGVGLVALLLWRLVYVTVLRS